MPRATSLPSVTDREDAVGGMRGGIAWLIETARDAIALGAPLTCAGCEAPGVSVCTTCASVLVSAPRLCRPTPPPPLWPPTQVVSDYAGVTRSIITAWKERGRRDVAPVLAVGLAHAVLAAVHDDDAPIAIVPIPSTRAARRRRGEDVWCRVARLTAAIVNDADRPASVEGALAVTRQPRDQSTLSARQRHVNLHGALECRRLPAGTIVLVDDIVTTGATLSEAARAIVAMGAPRPRAAAIAATSLIPR